MPSFINRNQLRQTLAAIDVGSNAMRAVIAWDRGDELEEIRSIREPLRLGEDVFSQGTISEEKMELTEEAFIKLFHTFVEYNVSKIRAVATSAMRDAKNGQELAKRIFKSTGIEIETISGSDEAKFILNAVKQRLPLEGKRTLHMDIGGGSTEISVIEDGKVLGIHSFNVGTVRLLRYKSQEELEVHIRLQIQKMLRFISSHFGKKKPEIFIGTGGNLRRIGKIRKKTLNRPSVLATFEEISHMEEAILSMSYVDRIRSLELDQNRADVILPAIMLTHHLMEQLKLDKILLPKVGLKEGVLLSMLETSPKRFILRD